METLTIKSKKRFLKQNQKSLQTYCNIEEIKKEDSYFYTIKDINDEPSVNFILAKEIIRYFFSTYYKNEIKKEFPEEYKEIYKNHTKNEENQNHFIFLTIPALKLYFKNNVFLNIESFLTFNIHESKRQVKDILNMEKECGDNLFEEERDDSMSLTGEDMNTLTIRYQSMFDYLDGRVKAKKRIECIHVYYNEKGHILITNEDGQTLTEDITFLSFLEVEEYYLKNCNKDAVPEEYLLYYLSLNIIYHNPEMVVFYDNMMPSFKSGLYKDLEVINKIVEIQTEVYTSEEEKPEF